MHGRPTATSGHDTPYGAPQPRCGVGLGSAARVCLTALAALGVLGQPIPPVAADDPVPQFVREWGPQGSAAGQLAFPWDLTLDHDGNLVIADTRNRRIQIFDTAGNLLRGWPLVGVPLTLDDGPTGVAVAANGDLYVVDHSTLAIQIYDGAGNHIGGWGKEGIEDDEFLSPRRIDLDADGNVYVTDGGTVKIFGPTGVFRDIWRDGVRGAQLSAPNSITISPDGYAYVTDIGLHTVQKFSLNGDLVTRWGVFGDGLEQFKTPLDSAFDADGNLWVIDHHNFRIQKFTPDGSFLTVFGERGREDGQFVDPIALVINDDGDIFITDFTNDGFVQHFRIPDTTAVQSTTWTTLKTLYRAPTPPR
jgi:DNA-binding beta-propeller fold protein YncE